jgi:hypothetical protein
MGMRTWVVEEALDALKFSKERTQARVMFVTADEEMVPENLRRRRELG